MRINGQETDSYTFFVKAFAMSGHYANLGRSMAKGAAWTILMRFSVRCIGIVSTVILARLLMPEDFGLVAIATMMVALLELMSQLNFATFLIRSQDAGREHYDTVWTLMAVRGVLTGILLVVAAPLIAAFFEDARLEPIVYVMAGACVISGLSNIGVVDFQRFLDFERDFQLMVRTKLAGFVVTITLALAMRNYWALVIGILSSRLAELALSYTMHPYRPRLGLKRTREIMRFSVWLLANNILFFTQRRCDFAIIGKLLDSASLGLYSVAHEIASMVTSELVQPIQRVLLPGLSKLSHDPHRLSRAFLDCLAVTVMVGLPIAAGIGLTADPLIRLALGPKWTGAIPLLQILIIIGIARVCSSNIGAFFLAFNRPRLTTCSAALATVVGVPLILFGAWQARMIGAAWGAAATAVLVVLVNYALLWRNFGLSPLAVLGSVWRSIASCLAMTTIVLALPEIGSVTGGTAGLALQLLLMAAVGATAYLAAHLALWRVSGSPPGAEAHALELIRKSVKRFRARPVVR